MRYSAESTGVEDCPTSGFLLCCDDDNDIMERELLPVRRVDDESDSACDCDEESTLSAMMDGMVSYDGTVWVGKYD